MANSKRHHYVPQFYLRYFVDPDGLLHVYDKEGQSHRVQTPGNTTVQNKFYGYSDRAGNYHDEIENYFAEIESSAKGVLDRWQQSSARPEPPEMMLMSQFLALSHCRVPRTINAAMEVIEISAFEGAKIAAERTDLFEEFLAKARSEGRYEGIDTNEFLESLAHVESRFTVKANPKFALGQSLRMVPTVAGLLSKMNWCLCRAPDNSNFITSDSPLCVFARRPGGKAILGAGFGLPNVEVYFPYSPKHCLRLENRQMQHRAAVSSHFVDDANRRMAANAERYVISSRSTAKVAALIERYEFTRSRPKLDRNIVSDIMGRRLRANLERNRPKKK
jgi:hypothetical protein